MGQAFYVAVIAPRDEARRAEEVCVKATYPTPNVTVLGLEKVL